MSQPFVKHHQRLFAGGVSTNASPQSRQFPEPIVYQYTLYYPGNIPLVITAGHGGSSTPGERTGLKMTHQFKQIPDLATTSEVIDISSFSESVAYNAKDDTKDGGDLMPWMPPRDQSRGGNFKKDLNTHSMALNLANAVSCLTSRESKSGSARDGLLSREESRNHIMTGIPERCQAQGPWGDDDSDSPFPPSPAPSHSPSLVYSTTSLPSHASSGPNSRLDDPTRMHYRSAFAQNYPHVIVFRVPRRFVDVNRNIVGENAIADHPVSEAAWREYHGLIDHVQKMALQNQKQQKPLQEDEFLQIVPDRELKEGQGLSASRGQQSHWSLPIASSAFLSSAPSSSASSGLLLDIHGHAHSTNLIEIGYLFNGSILAMDDDLLNAHAHTLAKESSIRSLISRVVQSDSCADPERNVPDEPSQGQSKIKNMSLSTLLRGRDESLGGMFQYQGLNSVPSPGHQAPCQECIYFFGGYTTQAHVSRDPSFDTIQLELPKTLRLVEKEEGREISMKLGKAVVEFMARYYGVFEDHPRSPVVTVETTNQVDEIKNVLVSASEVAPNRSQRESLWTIQSPPSPQQQQQRQHRQQQRRQQHQAQRNDGRHHHRRVGSEAGENHSGDSDIEDRAMSDSKKSTRQHPEMKHQSSRL
ncbi:hypothetical protein BGZ79_000844 [Entomortierella chlamydospora]|nr:hypothetical protein BGZ79_000844 [Entomortierella chlamydospora]